MGVNMLAVLPPNMNEDDLIQFLNETYGEESISQAFDWCDLYPGTDTKTHLTKAEALAIFDNPEVRPWFVYRKPTLVETHNDTNWYRWVNDGDTILFLKARN